jgi:hypothetical protein
VAIALACRKFGYGPKRPKVVPLVRATRGTYPVYADLVSLFGKGRFGFASSSKKATGWQMNITDYLIETADQCALIAKQGRMLVEQLDAVNVPNTLKPLLQLSAGGLDLSERVEQIAQSLLAKAVEIDNAQEKLGRPPS